MCHPHFICAPTKIFFFFLPQTISNDELNTQKTKRTTRMIVNKDLQYQGIYGIGVGLNSLEDNLHQVEDLVNHH